MSQQRVSIESLAHGGDGVGRLSDGRTVFVPGSCPGDEVLVELTEDHGRWARAHVVSVVSASPSRVEPPCPYFGQCGGCQWQHVAADAQAEAKRRIVRDALERIGRIVDPPVEPVTPSPAAYGYRNRVELAVTQTARGPVCGFSQAGTHDVLPIDRCLLLPEHASRLPAAVAGALRFLATRGASGILRVTIRVSTSGEIACDLWTQGGPFPRNAVARTIAQATGARSVSRVIVRGAIERRDISNVEVLSGDGRWHESLGADRYVVSPASFFQVNTGAAMLLREMVVRCVAPDGVTRAADLYAGVGTFTLPMARLAGETVAVEASRYAISDLRRNLERNRLAAEIVPGDAARALPGLGGLDAVVLDPPRQGLAPEALTALAAAGVPRVVYVSCDPATLARDVRALSHAGYRAPRFWPVDLFPQTYHIETVALLERA